MGKVARRSSVGPAHNAQGLSVVPGRKKAFLRAHNLGGLRWREFMGVVGAVKTRPPPVEKKKTRFTFAGTGRLGKKKALHKE